MLWNPHLTLLTGRPHYISKSMKNYSWSQRALLLLYVEGILVIQLQSNVREPFEASGIDHYFNFCLSICSNRKFCYWAHSSLRQLLLGSFLILKQTSVMYQVSLCSYFCPLKLHRISLSPLLFYNSTEISMHLLYNFFLFCTSFPAIPSVLQGSIPLFIA